jgi:5'-deoxynucleotidase
MIQSTFLAWILRMPLIKRWAVMHSVKQENIAEHSQQVAVIAHLLVVIKNKFFEGTLNPEKAATIALYHEVSETKLQDINHVTKYHTPALTQEFKKLEEIAEIECLNSLPADLRDEFRPLIVQSQVDSEYKTIVKAADIVSAYLKACDEVSFGNREFEHVKNNLNQMLTSYKDSMPELVYFLNTFERNCFVSVDKLSSQDK